MDHPARKKAILLVTVRKAVPASMIGWCAFKRTVARLMAVC
jgi:hypothetical protein